ncbi:MAG: hypothetical protein ABFS14_09385 [Gemmatimonadota bacterium]
MSIIGFHKVLISTAIVFCLLFAGWEIGRYENGGGTSALVLAAVFFLLSIGLVVYLINLKRILRRKSE